MAPLTLYDLTIPSILHHLRILDSLLSKAETQAKEKGVDLSTYINGKLAEDMAPLPFNVGAAGEFATFLLTRLTDIPITRIPHDESTFPQLHERIAARIKTFEDVKREDLEGKDDVIIKWKGMEWNGLKWATEYIMPNFWFHVVTSYAILRHKGVDIGKADFLGLPADFWTRPA